MSWSWQRVVVVSVLVIGATICGVMGADTIGAALIGLGGGLSVPGGKPNPNGT
jgi:hypothetical protein